MSSRPIRPHNLPFTVLGAALLWFGWFGFNAGSALAANELAANAFVTTHMATAAAGLTWALMEWWHNDSPTILGAATGAVAGLVAVTPACGYVNPMNAMFIGIMVSIFCYLAVVLIKCKLGYDDSLDAFGVHGVGGIWGTIATGTLCGESGQRRGGGRHAFRKFATVSGPVDAFIVVCCSRRR